MIDCDSSWLLLKTYQGIWAQIYPSLGWVCVYRDCGMCSKWEGYKLDDCASIHKLGGPGACSPRAMLKFERCGRGVGGGGWGKIQGGVCAQKQGLIHLYHVKVFSYDAMHWVWKSTDFLTKSFVTYMFCGKLVQCPGLQHVGSCTTTCQPPQQGCNPRWSASCHRKTGSSCPDCVGWWKCICPGVPRSWRRPWAVLLLLSGSEACFPLCHQYSQWSSSSWIQCNGPPIWKEKCSGLLNMLPFPPCSLKLPFNYIVPLYPVVHLFISIQILPCCCWRLLKSWFVLTSFSFHIPYPLLFLVLLLESQKLLQIGHTKPQDTSCQLVLIRKYCNICSPDMLKLSSWRSFLCWSKYSSYARRMTCRGYPCCGCTLILLSGDCSSWTQTLSRTGHQRSLHLPMECGLPIDWPAPHDRRGAHTCTGCFRTLQSKWTEHV